MPSTLIRSSVAALDAVQRHAAPLPGSAGDDRGLINLLGGVRSRRTSAKSVATGAGRL